MSDGDRHHIVAYSGIAAAFGFAVAAALLPVEQKPTPYTQQSQSGQPAKSAEQWAAETCAEAAKSTEPDNAEKQPRDLCAQFSAAAASERSAVFAEGQYRLGWIGLAGLAATVIVAVMAWLAARRSADADNKALRLTRKQLREARRTGRAQVRAYVELESPGLENLGVVDGEDLFEVTVTFKNHGQSPARNLAIALASRVEPIPVPEDLTLIPLEYRPPIELAAIGPTRGGKFSHRSGFPIGAASAISAGHIALYVGIRFTYFDVFEDRIDIEERFFSTGNLFKEGRFAAGIQHPAKPKK